MKPISNATQRKLFAELDAYGHLHWTVGNADWLACFDAVRRGPWIAYQVVVNCESGGFIDTMEQGVLPATHEATFNLRMLPDYWAGICVEHYLDDDEYGTPDDAEVQRTTTEWAAHLDGLLAGARR